MLSASACRCNSARRPWKPHHLHLRVCPALRRAGKFPPLGPGTPPHPSFPSHRSSIGGDRSSELTACIRPMGVPSGSLSQPVNVPMQVGSPWVDVRTQVARQPVGVSSGSLSQPVNVPMQVGSPWAHLPVGYSQTPKQLLCRFDKHSRPGVPPENAITLWW